MPTSCILGESFGNRDVITSDSDDRRQTTAPSTGARLLGVQVQERPLAWRRRSGRMYASKCHQPAHRGMCPRDEASSHVIRYIPSTVVQKGHKSWTLEERRRGGDSKQFGFGDSMVI